MWNLFSAAQDSHSVRIRIVFAPPRVMITDIQRNVAIRLMSCVYNIGMAAQDSHSIRIRIVFAPPRVMPRVLEPFEFCLQHSHSIRNPAPSRPRRGSILCIHPDMLPRQHANVSSN